MATLGPRGARFPHCTTRAAARIAARAPTVTTVARAGARVMNLGTDLYEDLYEKLSDLGPRLRRSTLSVYLVYTTCGTRTARARDGYYIAGFAVRSMRLCAGPDAIDIDTVRGGGDGAVLRLPQAPIHAC